jgi:hypothetical protein|tara:strand:- start:18 stop:341 length:324 start_codon:yes stop_codon:yes gene_type:complete
MSKWKSETFGLESKAQLKEHRENKLKELCSDNDLIRLNSFAWTTAEIALQQALWDDSDNNVVYGYEARKAVLRGQLTALATNDLVKYFQEIGVPESSVEDYLPESPV